MPSVSKTRTPRKPGTPAPSRKKPGDKKPARSMTHAARPGSSPQAAKKTLEPSEARYQRLFEITRDGILILDADSGEIIDVNPTLCKMLGIPQKEFLGKQPWDISPFRNMEAGRAVLKEAQKKKILHYDNIPLETRDGRHINVEFVSSLSHIDGQHFIHCNLRDITARVRMEDAERSSNPSFRILVEQIPAITYIDKADKSALSLFVSPQIESILGIPREEWIQGDNEYWARMIHPDDRKRVLSHYARTIDTGEPFREEYRMFARDGHQVWIDDHAVLVRGADGKPISLQGVMFDITEQKQVQALQEAVYQIAMSAEKAKSLDDLFPQIHGIISSVMPAENFYITLYDEEHNMLRFPYFRDAVDEPFLGEIEPGKGLTAYVLRTGRSLLCTQAVHDELERQGAVKLLGVPSAIWLGVPLIIEEKTIGAMVVQHYSDPGAYGLREQHMLEFVSSQVAIAISRKQIEQELRYLSTHDVMTGLYNRVYFEVEITRLQRSRHFPVSIVMADMDHLKETNDLQGHNAGDALLKATAEVLTAAFRAEDVVARIGGDEFAVLLPDTDEARAEDAMARVKRILQERNDGNGGTPLLVSFGASTADKNALLTEVLKEADRKMYLEKQQHYNSRK